jgi:putative DNA primase/helicase
MQEFYWFQGVPKTGKSALADIWFYILGSYREIGYPRQFAEVQNEPHAEADYRLIGKRFIYTDEPKVKQWDGEKLKAFTGSTARVGRPMYGDSINFYPIGKLLFSSNDKPQINGADEGVGRRLRLIPFTRQIPEEMRNRLFVEEKLHPEAPYILHRMMQAAKQVLSVRNLPECSLVTESSQAYMNENDILRQFLSDCCTTDTYDADTTKNLYTAFTMWCNENSYDVPSQNKFGRMLSASGKDLSKVGGKRLRTKVKLNNVWAVKVGAPTMEWQTRN